ncbi:hypothetical protein LJR118_000599 [Acidovorax sp. LjRoot118]|uniref:hypothetical protein n=1 Tax=Acidovorax sp. LjRoot118 TaxID=3342256 RepID=UPI003ECD2F45
MDSTQITKLIADIIDQKILYNGYAYALLGGITLLNVAAVAFFTNYFKRRGETLALKADLNELTRQVAITTKATEEVKSAIAQSDWAAREWNSIQRIKLEEYLTAAYSMGDSLDRYRGKYLFDKDAEPDATHAGKLKMLSALYFPHLQHVTIQAFIAHTTSVQSIMATSVAIGSISPPDRSKKQSVMNDYQQTWKLEALQNDLALHNLEAAAAQEMQRLSAGPAKNSAKRTA